MAIKVLLILCWLAGPLAFGQSTVVNFEAVLEGEPINLSAADQGAAAGAKLGIHTLRYYVTGVQLLNGGTVVYTEPDSYHLVDAAAPESQLLELATPPELEWDDLQFTIGVDSTKTTAGVFGGDLDPTKGMYWTWRSGYINFKLEGTAAECPARGHRFQFHVGGYQAPFNTARRVVLRTDGSSSLTVRLDLDKIIRNRDLSTDYHIMSPTAEALEFADSLQRAFSLKRASR